MPFPSPHILQLCTCFGSASGGFLDLFPRSSLQARLFRTTPYVPSRATTCALRFGRHGRPPRAPSCTSVLLHQSNSALYASICADPSSPTAASVLREAWSQILLWAAAQPLPEMAVLPKHPTRRSEHKAVFKEAAARYSATAKVKCPGGFRATPQGLWWRREKHSAVRLCDPDAQGQSKFP